ncbi:septum formation initiator family protein [uncultured Brevundimonas sp.]|uniref:FtsB family cell division protein n=1 Tax=uncultured Brevundimonas sp. TaxID=213418 RepID=UPI0030EEF982|tara:strand:+ start:62645 stop:62974 length:330 start_codon:yes stop_codon:yes gene_type:complete
MKSYTLSACLLLMIVYLGVQALTGQRGLLSGGQRDALLDARETQLHQLVAERSDLEVRVRYLRSDSLSRDLLEERARAVIGFADPRDYVIPISNTAPAMVPGRATARKS